MRLLLCLLVLIFATPAIAEDRDTYVNIVERVDKGEGYYAAAADELRKGNFPLKPALAFRPPTLAVGLAAMPGWARLWCLIGLTLFAILAFSRSRATDPPWKRLSLVTLLMCGLANVGGPGSVYLHEAWAIALLTCSLAFYRHLGICLAFLAAAVLVRETSLVFAVAMGLVALVHNDRKRAVALIALGLAAGALWLWHASLVSAVVLTSDQSSPGWANFEGPSLVLAAMNWNLLTAALAGAWLVFAALVMLGSLPLVREPQLQTGAFTVILFCVGLLAFGRPDNNYWGIMFAPFLGFGLPALFERIKKIGGPHSTMHDS